MWPVEFFTNELNEFGNFLNEKNKLHKNLIIKTKKKMFIALNN